MSPQLLSLASRGVAFTFRGLSLSVGIAVLASSGSAIAHHTSGHLGPDILSQATQNDSGTSTSTVNQPRFTCEQTSGQYVVMYHPESQPGQSYAWATPGAMGGGWSPDRRCAEISRRLESYRPDGLVEMQTAIENGYNTVCVTTEKVPSCRIVLTVPPGQDPIATRNSVFQNLTVADSGQQTQGVNTFTGANQGDPLIRDLVNIGSSVLGGSSTTLGASQSGNINLQPFLDPADGGTGTKLRGGMPGRNSPRLNPGNFR